MKLAANVGRTNYDWRFVCMRKVVGRLKVEHDYSLDIFKVSDDNGFCFFDVSFYDRDTREHENIKFYTLDELQEFIRGLI